MDSAFQELLEDFMLEARERLDTVEELLLSLAALSPTQRRAVTDQTRRELHTLKGNSGMMGFSELQQLAHKMEDEVEELDVEAPQAAQLLAEVDRFRTLLRQQVQAGEAEEPAAGAVDYKVAASQELAHGGVRVPFAELDTLVEQLAEVVLYRNRLADALERVRRLMPRQNKEAADAWDDLEDVRLSFQKVLDFLQDRVLQLRMVPLQTLFRHLNRIVHDESVREGKQVRLETQGGETPLDKALLELASEALGHLVRNAVNHGIEAPGQREAAGKPEQGSVRLSARVHGGEVHIEVADDGGGVNLERLAATAERLGLAARSERELYSLLFRAGVSTREGADLSAGRGIGLSAVAESVRRHGGRVDVSSQLGTGTRFQLRLPLSVSITRALFLRVDGEEYALPLGAVIESQRYRRGDGSRVQQSDVLEWRGYILPLLDLGRFLDLSAGNRAGGFVVIVEALGNYRALVVDEITGIRDIVVKGLDPLLEAPTGIAGSTILGDGRVVLILDPAALTELPAELVAVAGGGGPGR